MQYSGQITRKLSVVLSSSEPIEDVWEPYDPKMFIISFPHCYQQYAVIESSEEKNVHYQPNKLNNFRGIGNV